MKIVIRVNNWIGDVAMSLPALDVLRAHHPNAEMVAVCRPWVRDVLNFRSDLIDRYMVFDDQIADAGVGGLWRFSRRIRAEKFDLAVAFTSHFKGAAIMFLGGVPRRLGIARPESRPFLTHSVNKKDLPTTQRHLLYHFLDLLEVGGYDVSKAPNPRLKPDDALTRQVTEKFLQGLPRPILGVHAGAAFGTAKRWIPERYAEACRAFLAKTGGSVILLGVDSEAETNHIIAKNGAAGLHNLCGKTALKESIALISQTDAFLSNDSGLTHVAAAFARPQVAVFGPTDPTASYPKNDRGAVISHPVDCGPCHQRECPIGTHDCMKGVRTNAVMDLLFKQMNLSQTGG